MRFSEFKYESLSTEEIGEKMTTLTSELKVAENVNVFMRVFDDINKYFYDIFKSADSISGFSFSKSAKVPLYRSPSSSSVGVKYWYPV